jgi:ribosomal protein S18 acetylase RimI-like enzyme
LLEGKLSFTIRPGTEDDLPEMLRLWREMMDFHARVEPRFRPLPPPAGERAWGKHLREDVWGNEEWCVLVAEADGGLVGQIMGVLRDPAPVFESERYGYVTDIVVDPAERRSRVGRVLFEALKVWFRERKVSYLQLTVAHNNPVSQAFWREMGCTDYMDTLWCGLEVE